MQQVQSRFLRWCTFFARDQRLIADILAEAEAAQEIMILSGAIAARGLLDIGFDQGRAEPQGPQRLAFALHNLIEQFVHHGIAIVVRQRRACHGRHGRIRARVCAAHSRRCGHRRARTIRLGLQKR